MRAGHALVALLALLISPLAGSQRILVKHLPDRAAKIVNYAQNEGLSLVGQTRGLLVLQGRPEQQCNSSMLQLLLMKARRWPGVVYAEQDKPRYMHRPVVADEMHRPVDASSEQSAESSLQGPGFGGFCVDRDIPLSNTSIIPEYRPYGIEQIQATSPKLPNRTDDKGVILCVIDSGLDTAHPDLLNNTLDGCKYEDSYAPAGCPFVWGRDLVGHGTHVAGTMAAQQNDFGVVGVIPGPAELYVVRVFNDSGDVNQGQGLVYGSTLILAFTQCEGRLAAQQVAFPERNYRMVVSMSLGAPGPLTIERMFFREAAKRGDIVFVASSGNNGSSPTLQAGQLTTTINPGNYPGTYPEVIAVAAVDCNNNLGPFSQKNPSVDISAPGVEVLSTASTAVRPSARSGGFKSQDGKIFIRAGIAGAENQIWHAGIGSFAGEVVDCGFGFEPCPQAKGKIALVQYDPRIKNVTMPARESAAAGPRGPSPVNGSKPGVVKAPAGGNPAAGGNPGPSILPPAGGRGGGGGVAPSLSPIRPPGGGAFAGGASGGSAGNAIPNQIIVPLPTRFNCELMDFAMQQGAKAVLIGAPPSSSGYYGAWGYVSPGSYLDLPLVANLRCDAYNCTCWPRIANLTKLPAAGLTLRQYGQVKDALAAAQKAGKPFEGRVTSQIDAFQRLSGTSMAVPHVSSAIARIWAAYPWCRADTVRAAIEESALDLGPKGKDVQFGHGLLQAEAAFDYLARQPCAKGEEAAAVSYKQQDEMNRGVGSPGGGSTKSVQGAGLGKQAGNDRRRR